METVFLYVLTSLCTLALLRGLANRAGYTTFPVLVAAVYSGWFFPQAFILLDDLSVASDDFVMLLLMATMSFLAIVAGWRLGLDFPLTIRTFTLPPFQKTVLVTAIVTAVAATIQIMIQNLPAEALLMRQPSGIITILRFFSSVRSFSLAMALLLFLRCRSPITTFLVIINFAIYAPDILLGFKRSVIVELGVSVLIALWFARRYSPSRMLIIASVLGAVVILHGFAELRVVAGYSVNSEGEFVRRIPTLDDIARIDWVTIGSESSSSNATDVKNAIVYMGLIEDQGILSLGGQFWNQFVQHYIPGQFVGYELKRDMMIGKDLFDFAFLEYSGFSQRGGSTLTGFLLPYADFGISGCLVFLLMSYILSVHYKKSMRGSFISQVFYIGSLMFALTSLSHSAYTYFVMLPVIIAVLIPAHLYLKYRPRLGEFSKGRALRTRVRPDHPPSHGPGVG